MVFQDLPIKGKVRAVILLTSVVALLLTAAAFTVYDLVTYRRAMIRSLSATAAILAGHGAAALAAKDQEEAQHILDALRADSRVVAAAFYDRQGNLFACYPGLKPVDALQFLPEKPGYYVEGGRLVVFEPVTRAEARLGVLRLESEIRPLYLRLRFYLGIALLVLAGSLLVALSLSHALQRRITEPILALVDTAKTISDRRDLSVRTPRRGGDELGQLSDAFNQMLTRLQEAEEARSFLAAIVESSDAAIIGKDLEGRVVSWNIGAERMFGYTAAEMLGQPITRILSPDRLDEEPRILEEIKQGAIRHCQTVRCRKDGRPLDVALTVSPIKNRDGKIIGISSIARDITEWQRAQEQIQQMNLRLEQRVQVRTAELTAANKELEAFTYSVAHDLRAPLRHIDAFSRILREEYAAALPADARRYLENIRQGSRQMSQLVDDLLNLARVGRQALKCQPTPLDRLVQEVLADLKGETEGRAIEWRIQPLPTIECDPGLMKQVFANLLSNAVKYTRPRFPAIIEVGSLKMDGDAAVFVRDNGVGFNMKYVDKLFGVFQRLHRAEEFEGTGVGLATVERIIRKHGGCVWAEGAVGKGAAFYFVVPGLGH